MPVSDSLVSVIPARGASEPGGDPVSPLDGGRRGGGGRRRPAGGARLSAQSVPVDLVLEEVSAAESRTLQGLKLTLDLNSDGQRSKSCWTYWLHPPITERTSLNFLFVIYLFWLAAMLDLGRRTSCLVIY